MGKVAALLKEMIEFSLMALILLSDDCNTFIPLPLCPITANFGVLQPPLPIARPDQIIIRFLLKKKSNNRTAWIDRSIDPLTYLWEGGWSRVPARHFPGPGPS